MIPVNLLALRLETIDNRRFCIHNRIECLVTTASYERDAFFEESFQQAKWQGRLNGSNKKSLTV